MRRSTPRRRRYRRGGSGACPSRGRAWLPPAGRGGGRGRGVAALSVRVQGPVREQPLPLQPVKMEPAAGAAVKVTAVPLANAAEHAAPQEIPAGLLVIVPVPVPVLLTASVKVE